MTEWIIVLILAWINGLMDGWCAHAALEDRKAERKEVAR